MVLEFIRRGNQLFVSGICTSRLFEVSFQTWSVTGKNCENNL
jgi:hypothetical protein